MRSRANRCMKKWNYKKADIRELKADGTDVRYAHFPNELPQGSKNVHWICRPGMMQGSPAKMLYFNASAEYVQGIQESYKDTAIDYTYQNNVNILLFMSHTYMVTVQDSYSNEEK